MTDVEVHGFAEPGYGKVADAFAANFDAGEVGAAVAVEVGGARVVDLWAGDAHPDGADAPEGGRRWRADTLAVMFSCGKGVTTLCLYLLVQDGVLDLDQPMAAYWPEFAAAGKDRLTVRQALAHRAGLPVLDGPTTRADVLDWDTMTSRLAAQAPLWEPNSGYLYHAVTFGWLAGEIIRRISGQLPGDFLASRLTGPLGLELWIGLPASEHGRVARILPPTPSPEQLAAPVPARTEVDEILERTVSLNGGLATSGEDVFDVFNQPEILSAQLPGANGVATARSLARLYSCAVSGPDRFLTRESVTDATKSVSSGPYLLFRLNTVEIHLPPLRERREDIPLLAQYFLQQHALRYRKRLDGFDAAAMQALLDYPWPGNVRELEHTVERAVLMAQGNVVGASAMGLRSSRADSRRLEDMSLEEVESFLIQKALSRHDGNVGQAAQSLGLSRSALYRRLQRYGL